VTASGRVSVIASGLLITGMVASALMLRAVDSVRARATLDEVLYVSSPSILKRLSLGYDGLLADIYWTRAVQYFGGKHHVGAQEYKLLAPLLEIATTLDPHLTVAYDYGANFLAPKPPDGAGMPERAVKLEEFGIARNPDQWRLYYQLGFIYYMELHDYEAAADAFARGAQRPGAHEFLKLMAARMAEHAGDTDMARMMWTTTYESSTEMSIRANAAAHLRALRVDDDVTTLEKLVDVYRERTGHLPGSFFDLIREGILRGVPVDPLGRPYKLSANGHVELGVPDNFPFVKRGLPPGYLPPTAPKILPTD
jgi:tetratricopeptide (TPR) repeat protein